MTAPAPGTPPAPAGAGRDPVADKGKKTMFAVAGCGCAILAVVVLGIAAAVGIPAVVNYVRRSKAQEVHQNMDALTHLVVDHCQTQGGYAGLAAGPIPAAPTDRKQVAVWPADSGFARLGFAPNPVFYSYSLVPAGDGLEVVAEGDLDGDGQRSRYAVQCLAACTCSPLNETQPLE